METRKWIRRVKKHSIIFAVGCVISNSGFLLNSITSNHLFFGIGLYGMLIWAVNPLPLIYSMTGLKHYLKERKNPENAVIIGKDWLVLPVVLVGSMLLYWFSALIMVALTGGA